jgi:hypothetical protein
MAANAAFLAAHWPWCTSLVSGPGLSSPCIPQPVCKYLIFELNGLEIGHLASVVQSRILNSRMGSDCNGPEECPKQSKRQQRKGSQQKLEPMQQQHGRQLEKGRQLQ